MLSWRFHFKNDIIVNYLSTHWKWTNILDFKSWRWSALDMGFVEKWSSRMQGQWFFRSRAERAEVIGRDQKILNFFVGQLHLPVTTSPKKLVGGKILSALQNRSLEQGHWSRIWICILGIMKIEPPHPWYRCKCRHGLNSYCIPCTSLTSHSQLHIAIFKCFFYWFEVCSIDFLLWWVIFLNVLNYNRLFLQLYQVYQ